MKEKKESSNGGKWEQYILHQQSGGPHMSLKFERTKKR